MKRTKEQVQRDLNLDELPDDEFMAMLEELGDGDVVLGPLAAPVTDYSADDIVEEISEGAIGRVLARAREKRGLSLSEAGGRSGVTKARVHQIEQSRNVEVSTLVRLAGSLGYRVRVRLEPSGAEEGDEAIETLLEDIPNRS